MLSRPYALLLLALLLALPAATLPGQENDADIVDGESTYRLHTRDYISVEVFDEPDLSREDRITNQGRFRIPLVGNLDLEGLTVREAEAKIREAYIEARILRDPIISIRILEYAPREITVFGAVGRPGKFAFPAEVAEMDIVDVISRVGGFTPLAKQESVRVKRKNEEGETENFTVNVRRMIEGRGDEETSFLILPEDLIFVDERVF